MNYRIFGVGSGDKEIFKKFAECAISAVVSGNDAEQIKRAREAGLDYYICNGAFSCADESLFCRNVYDEPHCWFNSGCPNSETIRKNNLESYRTIASANGIKGIITDGCRFASPASSKEGIKAFFTCFCVNCMNKMDSMGFGAAGIKNSVKAFYDFITISAPFNTDEHIGNLKKWLEFRRICATEHFKDIYETVKSVNNNLSVGHYIFTPSLCGLVGQSYTDIVNYADFISPMIYRNYRGGEGPACLNHELAAILLYCENKNEAEKKNIIDCFRRLTGIDYGLFGTREEILNNGVPARVIKDEIIKARELAGGVPVIPIILLDDEALDETIGYCAETPVETIDFFMYEDDAFEIARPVLLKYK